MSSFDAPGASARRMADDARRAAPVRSLVARLLGVHTDERAWRVGAKGEALVAAQLAKLSPLWSAFHDLPIDPSGANCDHMVVGPGGVYSLNAKNVAGSVWVAERTLMVNGHRTDWLRKAAWEAGKVSEKLSAAVGSPVLARPVIVVIADRLTVKADPMEVDVVGRRRIRGWLESRPQLLEEGERQALAAAAGDPNTWSM